MQELFDKIEPESSDNYYFLLITIEKCWPNKCYLTCTESINVAKKHCGFGGWHKTRILFPY